LELTKKIKLNNNLFEENESEYEDEQFLNITIKQDIINKINNQFIIKILLNF